MDIFPSVTKSNLGQNCCKTIYCVRELHSVVASLTAAVGFRSKAETGSGKFIVHVSYGMASCRGLLFLGQRSWLSQIQWWEVFERVGWLAQLQGVKQIFWKAAGQTSCWACPSTPVTVSLSPCSNEGIPIIWAIRVLFAFDLGTLTNALVLGYKHHRPARPLFIFHLFFFSWPRPCWLEFLCNYSSLN